MKIRVLLPSATGERNGNTVTGERWRAFFGELGHHVLEDSESLTPCDVLIALNAYKNRPRILEAVRRGRARRLVLCLTGTDIYEQLPKDRAAWDVLELADRLIVLQPGALEELPPALQSRTSVVYQSAVAPLVKPVLSGESFDVAVIAHLREVKDPLRTAQAARLVPETSRIRIVHVGKALSDQYAATAEREQAENPRFRWLGEQSMEGTQEVLIGSRLLCLTSVLEGGANVISEAVVAGVPVLATRISCTTALLGAEYPGLFPVGDTEELARLLSRAETDPLFYGELRDRCRSVAWKFEPSLERESLGKLLDGLFAAPPPS